MIALGYICAVLYVIACILLAAIAQKAGLAKRYTRKIVHIFVGFEWVILHHFFDTGVHFLIVCIAFTIALFISYKKDLMPMMSSDTDNAPGTFYYGASMSVMALICYFSPDFIYPFGIAVFCTSVGDGLAGIFGAMLSPKIRIYKEKTLFGSLSAFLFSVVSTILFAKVFDLGITLLQACFLGLFAAGLELLGERGLDNIILPLGVFGFSYLVLNNGAWSAYVLPIILTAPIIAIVSSKELLSPGGIVFAVLLDVAVSYAFGNFGFVLLLTFLLLSALVDKLKGRISGKREGSRGRAQVIANGAVPLILAMLYTFTGQGVFILAYTAAVAEAFADTCASGLGIVSVETYDICRFRRIKKGLSGGVSFEGTVAAVFASLALPLIAAAFGIMNVRLCTLAGLCAFVGVMIDSILGSLIQVKYKCPVCEEITEKPEHCGAPTQKYSGVSFVNNNAVNLISTAVSAALAIVLYFAS